MIINLNFNNKIFLILSLFIISSLSGQTDDEYKFLNEVMANLISHNLDGCENKIDNQILEFEDDFFSKDFLINYTYPTLGTEVNKVKKLIKNLDFNYFSNQKMELGLWDVSRFAMKFKMDSSIGSKCKFRISRVYFSEKKDLAIVFFERSVIVNGYVDSGSTTVKIYKKRWKKWKFYVQIPVSI